MTSQWDPACAVQQVKAREGSRPLDHQGQTETPRSRWVSSTSVHRRSGTSNRWQQTLQLIHLPKCAEGRQQELPIDTEYFLPGEATTLKFIVDGAKTGVMCSRSLGKWSCRLRERHRRAKSLRVSASHWLMRLGWSNTSAQRKQVSTVVLSISACSQTSIPSNLCAMASMMLSTAFKIPFSRSLLLSPSCICNCRHVGGPDVSQPTSIAPLPCVDDVVIRAVDHWQVTSGLFIEPLQTRHPLSRSRSVTHVQKCRIT